MHQDFYLNVGKLTLCDLNDASFAQIKSNSAFFTVFVSGKKQKKVYICNSCNIPQLILKLKMCSEDLGLEEAETAESDEDIKFNTTSKYIERVEIEGLSAYDIEREPRKVGLFLVVAPSCVFFLSS